MCKDNIRELHVYHIDRIKCFVRYKSDYKYNLYFIRYKCKFRLDINAYKLIGT